MKVVGSNPSHGQVEYNCTYYLPNMVHFINIYHKRLLNLPEDCISCEMMSKVQQSMYINKPDKGL